MKAREIWNARLQLSDIALGNSSAEIVLWGKNILDKDHVRSKFDSGNAILGEWEDPRSYGIEATFYY